ncbi:methylamine utilization protein [Aliiglaciecola sp. CAU 1673]|uniref:methylamine utilization protein n=1 Tax=Aliiglaciecola sp. CAU 1673 TaxID=3032595 RepID=UPI0023D9D458|nr:methylamine utilization protein [Aliiglaciecola sp. CAU 1673]MDF2179464.1 methylamine utilization protein [Aliiglaciecola sp. CAU 1673]
MTYRWSLGWILLFACSGMAAELEVEVKAPDSRPLAHAVVYLLSDAPLPPVKPGTVAEMDQIKKQFKPHILVVQKDTQIVFPNSDSIKHHVYSFSPAKTFELQLYKEKQPALPFDTPGQVELGCNVHDWMLGYIYVVDTPYFAQTDASGVARIEAPAGNYRLYLRHPRIQDAPEALETPLQLGEKTRHRFVLQQPLLPSLQSFEEDTDEFSGYE